jgi:hypothetical protein
MQLYLAPTLQEQSHDVTIQLARVAAAAQRKPKACDRLDLLFAEECGSVRTHLENIRLHSSSDEILAVTMRVKQNVYYNVSKVRASIPRE